MERRRRPASQVVETPKATATVETPKAKNVAPKPKATPKRTHYFIANHHTADIVFPRQAPGSGGKLGKTKPLVLPTATAIPVEADEWNVLRNNPVVQNYIDAHLISEVVREGSVPASAERTSAPPIPEHLETEEEAGQRTGQTAGVRRSKANTITIG